MRIKMPDGRLHQGTARQIIESLRAMDFSPGETLGEYVVTLLHRVMQQTGLLIDVSSERTDETPAGKVGAVTAMDVLCQRIIASLISAKLVEEVA